ncbi:uncharacterized protein RHO25_007093 [Cercospora beticola]|uniref:Uncharacterized protein n=1 Tax=Cercospora beticola TaxID=122368 RepID=A0ABZ0NS95_CERBT|nr:hypothetical protein RHO25_007093 [Cercospora beticola]
MPFRAGEDRIGSQEMAAKNAEDAASSVTRPGHAVLRVSGMTMTVSTKTNRKP